MDIARDVRNWITRILMTGLTLLCVHACDKSERPYIARSVNDLYRDAHARLRAGQFEEAAHAFDEVERQHPYSAWATKARVMAAYSAYRARLFTRAIQALDNFLTLHPAHIHADYAYYLRALCYYDDILPITRDEMPARAAYTALNDVLIRFPHTRYALDAQIRLDFVTEYMAGKTMQAGLYYLKRGRILGGMSRFDEVITQFPKSRFVPEALWRMVECYTTLGLDDDARRLAAVLGHNFPRSTWYRYAYALFKPNMTAPSSGTALPRTRKD